MCSKDSGTNVTLRLKHAGGTFFAERHWCKAKTVDEGNMQAQAILWGILSAVFQVVPEGEEFDFAVFATGLEFVDSPAAALGSCPENHPLSVHADVFRWHESRPRRTGGK